MINYSSDNKALTGRKGTFSNPALAMLAIVFTLLLGAIVTSALYFSFVKTDRELVNVHVDRGAHTLALYASQPFSTPLIEEISNTLYSLQNAFNSNNAPVPEILEEHLWNDPMPELETTTLEFLPRVNYNEVNELNSRFNQHENTSRPILEENDLGELIPAKKRNEYYPVLFEASFNNEMAIIGLDRRNDLSFLLAMQQARDTGIISSTSSFPMTAEGKQIITHYYLPLYKANTENTTIEQRRKNHTGFVSAVTYQQAQQALPFLPDSIRGIDSVFIPRSEAYRQEALDEEFITSFENGIFIEVSYQIEGAPFVIISKASKELIDSLKTNKPSLAIQIGTIISLLICAMILWSRKQSNTITELVMERTQGLVERTNLLAEANIALSESEARYRMLADNASDVIYTHDMDGICTYISPSIKQHNGFEVSDYIGMPITTHLSLASTNTMMNMLKTAVINFRDKAGSRIDNHIFEFETYCKDNSLKYIENTISFIFDESGKPTGVLGVSRDVTQRKHAEHEKEELENIYRQSQKMEAIGTLAGGIAHDFNNLLAGILGYADLLKLQVTNNPEAEESIDVIEKSAIRAKDLTSQLLGFARKGQYQAIAVDINVVLLDIIKLIERTIDKNIKISQFFSKEKVVVSGDLGQLTQLFLNLAINANDAMPDGGKMTFETHIVELDEEFSRTHLAMKAGKYNLIMISDTGIGMSDEKMDRIFEPFFTDKDNGKGTGLGLAMVYGVTKNHGGVVSVYSSEGIGTTFKVYLPFSGKSIPETKKESPAEAINGAGNILVVDDEELVREMAKTMLTRLGYSVSTAKDGTQAIKYYQKNWKNIDVVVVDMIMPNMGGIECLYALNEINSDVKVIISTGYSREAMAEKLNEEHIRGFLQKPFKLKELSEIISSTLN